MVKTTQKPLISRRRGTVVWAGTETESSMCRACSKETKKVQLIENNELSRLSLRSSRRKHRLSSKLHILLFTILTVAALAKYAPLHAVYIQLGSATLL